MRVVGAEDVVAGLGVVLFHRGSVALAGLAQVVGCCAVTVGIGFARAGEAVRAQACLLVGHYRSGGWWLGREVNGGGGPLTGAEAVVFDFICVCCTPAMMVTVR